MDPQQILDWKDDEEMDFDGDPLTKIIELETEAERVWEALDQYYNREQFVRRYVNWKLAKE